MSKLLWRAGILITALVLLAGTATADRTWVPVDGFAGPGQPGVQVLSSNEFETVIQFSIDGFWSETVTEDGRTFQSLRLPEYFTTLDIGKPQLPAITELVGVPYGATVAVSIDGYAEQVLAGFDVLPFQTPLKENEQRVKFDYDDACYGQNAFYPGVLAEAGEPGLWRDLQVVKLAVHPFQFNPGTGELKVNTDLTVRLTYGGAKDAGYTTGRPIPEQYQTYYRKKVINYDFLNLGATKGTDAAYDYLFITVDAYVDNLTPLVNLKNSQGLSVQVTPMSSVGSTVDDVKNYIQQEYNTNGIQYVLLVGNETDIPGYLGYGFFSDYYYSLLAGSDDYPDIAIGRFCAHSATDVDNMVSKSEVYDNNPPSGDWLDNALLVAHLELAPDKYQLCSEEIRTATYNYFQPVFTTAYGASAANGGDEASNADVKAYINSGMRVVNYRGHGDVTEWWQWNIYAESFFNSDVADLNNGTTCPVVFSIACLNGNLASASTTLGEAFTNDVDAAAAMLCASDPSYTTPNHDYDKWIFRSIYNDSIEYIGDATNAATVDVINTHGTYGLANARMYLWLGDPTLRPVYTGGPTANFSGTPTSGCIPLTVNFTDLSMDSITSWNWDFGDGVGTSTEQNPSYTYTTPGNYTVTLLVTNAEGSDTETKVDYIVAMDVPVADFSGTPTSGGAPLEVTFTDLSYGNATDWSWDFGDGGTSFEQNPVHYYLDSGMYTVTLAISNDCGSDQAIKTDYISVGPPADPYASLPYATGFESGVFDEYWFTQSDNPEGRIEITTLNTPHTGSYHLTMDDNYDGGNYSLNEAWLRLNLSGLSDIDLTFWWKEFGDEDHTEDGVFFSDNGGITFTKVYNLVAGTSTYQQIVLDLDALAAANGLNLTNMFIIKFQQYDNYGITTDGFAFDDISVVSNEMPPVAEFSGTPTSGEPPLTVDFTDLSVGNPTSWNWDFGDGVGTSTEQHPTYTYTDYGRYTVSLTVTNPFGNDTETKVDYISVDSVIVSRAYALSDIPVAGTVTGDYTYTDSSDNNYEVITEIELTGHPVKIWSYLEHKWDFDVAVGGTITFSLEAYRPTNSDGDDFTFEYSLDDATYEPMVTVASAVEQTYTYDLPITTVGTVYIRVVDTDQGRGNLSLDPVYIDHMYIESSGSPPPPDTIHIHDITVTRIGGKANKWQGQAVVTVYSQDGLPVAGAVVDGHFTGPSSDYVSGATGSDGKAVILSSEVKGPSGLWCFYVDNVSGGVNIYDPTQNVENYDCEAAAKLATDGIPDQFGLYANAPNPFNPVTTICYDLPVESNVRLEIYNILGQLVTTLVDERQPAGRYEIEWNSSDANGRAVASGVYFYRIETELFVDSKKMVLLK